jgi:hypothetical protein
VNFIAFFSAHKALDESGVDIPAIPTIPKFSIDFTMFA